MKLRSMLFVPGDSDRKLAKSTASPADALILDLEDAVAPEEKAAARERVTAMVRAKPYHEPSGNILWARRWPAPKQCSAGGSRVHLT